MCSVTKEAYAIVLVTDMFKIQRFWSATVKVHSNCTFWTEKTNLEWNENG